MVQDLTKQPKLICQNVWKLFGSGGREFLLQHKGTPGLAELSEAGLISAVRNVNLEVNEGEIFVIMGLSGSGKSTLVRCLSRLIEPTAGEILFNGESLLAASDAQMIEIRRHKMGMVFQHFALLPHLNVLDNVAFPLSIQGIGKTERYDRARKMVELVGLKGREEAFPRQLSGGQQQRVGIARSLAVEPALWFLHEPFSAVDPLIRREMQDEFIRLQSVLKKTIVFITHDFDEAIRLADRIAIMKDGEIVQCGTPEEIVLNPKTGYVREFTLAVTKAKVVRVATVMKKNPAKTSKTNLATVQAKATIAEVAPMFLDGIKKVQVLDNNRIVGTLYREDVIDLMMRG